MIRHRLAAASVLVLLAGTAGCSDDDQPESTSDAAPTTEAPAGIDSMVVMGHSALTGFGSEGERDTPGNSWASGDNPDVDSVYTRLLAANPDLEGHNFNVAEDGAPADDLIRQAASVLELEPAPDLVIVQILGNDVRCDGSDPQQYPAYEATIDEVLTTLEGGNPAVQVLFVHHWSSMEQYADLLAQIPGAQSPFGPGRCGLVTGGGEPNPTGTKYLQGVMDGYFEAISTACARHDGCTTDEGGLQVTPLAPEDLTPDLAHLKVSGLAKEAATAWELLPEQLTSPDG